MTTTEKKIEWLNKATSEKLMDRYDLAYYQCTKTDNDEGWNEWVKLAREEILKRLSMKYTEEMIKNVACYISNPIYNDNLQATKELMELFDDLKEKKLSGYIVENPLKTYKDYVKMYDDSFYTYTTFEELVESEEEQNDGMTEEECREQINNTIWKLPCGWYVQYV